MTEPHDDRPPWADLEAAIGWKFQDSNRLREALTHSTYANENRDAGRSNERLEFLGDAVLDLIAARLLYEAPDSPGEGQMSLRRSWAVRQEALAQAAQALDLEHFLLLGQGQHRAGATESILADAFEALVAAVFLDGGYPAAEKCFSDRLARALEDARELLDCKTALQEACHRLGLPAPAYSVVARDGPDHAQHFSCEVRVGREVLGSGRGSSKKVAEQICAEQALEVLTDRNKSLKQT